MLSLGISFFVINAVNHSAINFRSFITYWVYLPAFLMVFYVAKLYPGIMLQPADEVHRCTVCSFFCFAGIALSIVVETDERVATIVGFLLAIPIVAFLIPLFREFARKIFSRFLWWGVPTVIYCKTENQKLILDRLVDHPEYGYRPVLIFNTDGASCGTQLSDYRGIPIRAPSDELHAIIKKLRIKTAVILENEDDIVKTTTLGDEINSIYRYTILIPSTQNTMSVSLSVRDLGGIIGFVSTNNLRKRTNLFIKRFIDIALIMIASPLIISLSLLIILGIKLTSPGPLFYGHARYGKNRKLFKAWKFRTMVVDADKKLKELLESDPAIREEWERETKLKNDPRVTGFGKFLRRTSLDELPQFWNIFIGEMSLVGPRPIPQSDMWKYEDTAKEITKYVLSITPGLSGMWQISGRSNTSYEERIVLDSYYMHNWSVWLDLWIIVKTIGVVCYGKGAY
jgi:Undecaprenyl-phosphate galactose phosphotransferase WbaP